MTKIDPFDIRTYPSFPTFKTYFLSKLPENYLALNMENECWNWQGTIYKNKYGKAVWGGTQYYAHRISYIIFKDLIPSDLVIRHTCDNPTCVNPNHLIIGSYSDNSLDCVKRNRHCNQKLTKEIVLKIKKQLKNPYKGINKDLAEKYNVKPDTISHIKTGRNWYWLVAEGI